MRAGARWALAATAVGVFATTGLSLYTTPSEELLYDTGVLFLCNERNCMSRHTLEIGNTGRAVIPQVIVRLDDDMVGKAMLGPRVSTFGKVPRSGVQNSLEEKARAYALGAMEPGERVELQVAYQARARDEIPSWDEILVSVDGGSVTSKRGDPTAVTFGRWMLRLFGW